MLDKIPRAAFFVDGSNFYHACVGAGALMRAVDYYDIDFQKLAKHLAGPNREVVSIRYYVAQLEKDGNKNLYDTQQRLFSELKNSGVMICKGRMVKRPIENKAAQDLSKLLRSDAFRTGLQAPLRRELEKLQKQTVVGSVKAWRGGLPSRKIRLSDTIYNKLMEWEQHHNESSIWQEKGVDVRLAIDMTTMAHQDKYDVAYLLSGDGDFSPAVEEVRSIDKKVFAVACGKHYNSALDNAADACIPIKDREYFHGLWRDKRSK